MTPINPADEFLKHAAECQQMARATRNPASKATWMDGTPLSRSTIVVFGQRICLTQRFHQTC